MGITTELLRVLSTAGLVFLFIMLLQVESSFSVISPYEAVDAGDEYYQAARNLPTFDDDYNDDWVDSNSFQPRRTIVVAQDGSGQFQSIQEAVSSIPHGNDHRVLIQVKAGFYCAGGGKDFSRQVVASTPEDVLLKPLRPGPRQTTYLRERVRISKMQHFITIEGDKDDQQKLLTVVAYNSTAADLGNNGLPLRTYESATFATNARNFIARNLVFKNTAPAPGPGAVGRQAVALRVTGDKSAFYGCTFVGSQDTLYDHKGRHFFQDCYMEGTIDIVFGSGRSLYKNCQLNALSNSGVPGSFTAQKASTSLKTGFSFVNCKVTGYASAYLGRPWGNYSRVLFANTFMDKVVVPEGWEDFGIPGHEVPVFYAEFNCTGPGANTIGRVRSVQLSYEQARPFLSLSYINGRKWLQDPGKIESGESLPWGPGLGPYNIANGSEPYQTGDLGDALDAGAEQQPAQPYQV